MEDDKEAKVATQQPPGDDEDRTEMRAPLQYPDQEAPQHASLLIISGPSVGKMFALDSKPKVIGREEDCDICIPGGDVSREHVRVEMGANGQVVVTDLGSTNGTYVDGIRVDSHSLRDGERFQLGSTVLIKFSYQDSIEEAFYRHQYEQAVQDGLTGLYNKRHFLVRLGQEIAYAARHRDFLSLIFFDIDHFKEINDTHGHPAGDMVLKRLADLVREELREEDLLARYGGEEFAVLVRGENTSQGLQTAERMRRILAETAFSWRDESIDVSASFGVATLSPDQTKTPEEMLEQADQRLYEAKDAGRNCCVGDSGQ